MNQYLSKTLFLSSIERYKGANQKITTWQNKKNWCSQSLIELQNIEKLMKDNLLLPAKSTRSTSCQTGLVGSAFVQCEKDK
jgi:hypothetical protein